MLAEIDSMPFINIDEAARRADGQPSSEATLQASTRGLPSVVVTAPLGDSGWRDCECRSFTDYVATVFAAIPRESETDSRSQTDDESNGDGSPGLPGQ